jgi:hypothetical protein
LQAAKPRVSAPGHANTFSAIRAVRTNPVFDYTSSLAPTGTRAEAFVSALLRFSDRANRATDWAREFFDFPMILRVLVHKLGDVAVNAVSIPLAPIIKSFEKRDGPWVCDFHQNLRDMVVFVFALFHFREHSVNGLGPSLE